MSKQTEGIYENLVCTLSAKPHRFLMVKICKFVRTHWLHLFSLWFAGCDAAELLGGERWQRDQLGKDVFVRQIKDLFSFAVFKLHVMTDQTILVEAEKLWMFLFQFLMYLLCVATPLTLTQAIQPVFALELFNSCELSAWLLQVVRLTPWQEIY